MMRGNVNHVEKFGMEKMTMETDGQFVIHDVTASITCTAVFRNLLRGGEEQYYEIDIENELFLCEECEKQNRVNHIFYITS